MTPIEAGLLVRAYYFRMKFSWALKEMKMSLNESTVEENVKVFKDALKKHKNKEVLDELKKAEQEPELIKALFKVEEIEEGEEYAFISNGQKMGGTIQKCDCCGKYCYVNGYQVDRFPRGVEPCKRLENIEEMAGWSEEREQAECETCCANDGKVPKKKVTKKTKKV